MIPASPLRVIADVHGHPDMLARAAGDAPALVLLGDLVDRGPDSPGVLRLALDWIESGRARMVRSNHDDKLARALTGRKITAGRNLSATLAALEAAQDAPDLKTRFLRAFEAAPFVINHGRYVMAHGAVHPLRFGEDGAYVVRESERDSDHMALYGEVDGTLQSDGKPVRHYNWVDALPRGVTAIVGHDKRGDTPFVHVGANGGRAIFLDTGCGKGGALSFIDLPEETIGQVQPSRAEAE
jgi:protein phosphatase